MSSRNLCVCAWKEKRDSGCDGNKKTDRSPPHLITHLHLAAPHVCPRADHPKGRRGNLTAGPGVQFKSVARKETMCFFNHTLLVRQEARTVPAGSRPFGAPEGRSTRLVRPSRCVSLLETMLGLNTHIVGGYPLRSSERCIQFPREKNRTRSLIRHMLHCPKKGADHRFKTNVQRERWKRG